MAEKDEMLFDDAELTDLDLEEALSNLLFYTLDEAITKMEKAGQFTPFTVCLKNDSDDVLVETHPGDNPEECGLSAKAAINLISHVSSAYTYCYDGYVETEEDGQVDAIIVEIAKADDSLCKAYCLAYTLKNGGDEIEFDSGLIDLGDIETMYDPDLAGVKPE